ncbi:RNA polymerase sigma factor [Kocuria sp.]|uniref:RNA polymerase sigma factor n=1 Tax=Kocuria sp. TaxID=1871328 RepID=UPI0026DF234D|nr:RNA polymerase sigma factor [Kocuria sp.]MDO5618507.1 RNA polymerase sigma factor [Kocuria sp.]
MSTDSDVIRGSLETPEQFAVLYDRHATPVYRYLTRRLGRLSAEDITSETFLAAFDSRTTFDLSRESALPWLLGIATNLANRHLRQSVRQEQIQQKAARLDPGHPADLLEPITEQLDHSQGTSQVMRALAHLSPTNRDTLLLHVWGELTYDQIAAATHVPVGTVRSRLHRARLTLRSHLSAPADSTPTQRIAERLSSPSSASPEATATQEPHHA